MTRARNFPEFKAEVRKVLTLKKRTYKDLADQTGYSLNYISGIMSGKECSEKALRAILNALELPESLADWQEQKAVAYYER